MTTATITHEGETLHVPIKNISLPAGHRLLAPNEVPDGFFTQEDLDEKIEDRLERERKKYEDHVELEDGDVVLSAEEAAKLKERELLTETDDGAAVSVETFDETKAKAEKADALEKKEKLREVAEVEGITNFDAFSELADGQSFEVHEEDDEKYATTTIEEDGEEKTIRVAEHPRYGREGTFAPAVYGSEQEQKKQSGPSYPQMTPVTKENKPGPSGTTVEEIKKRKEQSGKYAL